MCIRVGNNSLIYVLVLTWSFLTVVPYPVSGQEEARGQKDERIDWSIFADNSAHWYGIFDKESLIHPMQGKARYRPSQITEIADNILLFQKNNGGWPKNYDMFAVLTAAQKDTLLRTKNEENTTFDNGTTYTQVAVLARVYQKTKVEKYRGAVLKGLDFILSAQYPNGGWPQYYPLRNNYSRQITYNDGAFEGIMRLLKDICDGKDTYSFLPLSYRTRVKKAFEKGIECMINTQINEEGTLTAWCQQHDARTLRPVWARKFEPAAICNSESSGIVLFLMSIEHPSEAIVNAIQHAVRWFDESKILNTRVQVVSAPRLITPLRISTTDKVVVTDTTAPPIWTRYYELGTHRPVFCNRDSKLVYSLAEVERERRDGYSWYTYAPQAVLNRYQGWQKKWAPERNILKKL